MTNEDADERFDSQMIKLAEQYASCDRRSASINDERSQIRANAEKLGIPSKSFQHAVGMVKHMSAGERRDYQTGVNRVLKAISDRQGELYPDLAEKVKKREERKAAEAAAKTKGPDESERSNPKRGGAGGVKGRGRAKDVPDKPQTIKDAVQASDQAVDDAIQKAKNGAFDKHDEEEQQAGAAVLDGMTERVRSQSEVAQQKRADAGLE